MILNQENITGKNIKGCKCELGILMSFFDFNRDGKVDFWDHFLVFGIAKAAEQEYKDVHEWRDSCDYDPEYDVDPEDYETEDEFEEALNEAKYGWRDLCEDGSDYDLDPEDYETEEEYMDALEDAILSDTGDLFF